MSSFLIQRNGWYHYFRRVPAHLRRYDGRTHIRVALKTKDAATARRLAAVQNDAVEAFWRTLVASPGARPVEQAYRDAVNTARAHGFAYRSSIEIAEGSLRDVLDRLAAAESAGAQRGRAILGAIDRPTMLISDALTTYFTLTGDRMVGKSPDFIRKWSNPRKRAAANFIAAVGDKPVKDICREDLLAFRRWWMARISEGEMNPGTANKDLIHLKDVLRVVVSDLGGDAAMEVDVLFTGLNFRDEKNSRAPFAAAFVQDTILAPGALDDLNVEARALIYIMADTGCRVNEVIGLLPDDIFLDAPIPYIWIRPNKKRTLKTRSSNRQIPLVGAAVAGIRMVPRGFPRYKVADSVSNLVNQYFENHDMKPTPDHTLYSLRHTFKDRLRDAGAPEEVIDNLMGHSSRGPKYGRGHVLETKLKWLQQIAFKV